MAQATRDSSYGNTGTTGTTGTGATGYGTTGTTGSSALGGSAPRSDTRTTTGPGGETYVTTTVTEAVNTGSTAAVAATCDRQYYTTTEDRQRVLEQRELIREHHPFEKEFVVETKPTGRERALERPQSEVIDFKTRIVERVQPALCEGAPVISATGVHTRGQLTGEGITTIESARGSSGTTGTGTGTGTGLTGGGAGYTTSGTSTGIGQGSRATTGTTGYGSSTGTGAGTQGYGSTSGTGTGTTGTGRTY